MTTTYVIEVFQVDRPQWVSELSQAVAEELAEVGLHRSVNVTVAESSATAGQPTVGVYMGSSAASVDGHLSARIDDALRASVVIIPVVEALDQFTNDVPHALTFANGFQRSSPSDSRRLARILLENLGIEDRERRVFISHKRDDGLGAAEQLHDALSHAGFVPFIDRFAIRSGEGVQAAIADALEDHAFLLLLETQLAHTSDWVFDEVDYALSHTMGVLILRWPGSPAKVPGSQGLPRFELVDDDLVEDTHGYEVLVPTARERVLEAVEASHAQGLVRRRRMLVRSVEEAAIASGCLSCLPLPEWRLRVEHPTASTLVGITPRLPTANDLQQLDQARVGGTEKSPALLVHSARELRPERRAHLKWVTGPRDLALSPENAVGGWW